MSVKLIKVTKDGVCIEVHPTALEQHKALGWQEAPADAEVNAGLAEDAAKPKTKGAKAEADEPAKETESEAAEKGK